MRIKLEIMAASIESALSAQKGGADRVELCDNFSVGGTTPSPGLIQLAVDLLDIDVYVMIRPRGGDFFYSELEYKVMKNNVQFCKSIGAAGIVFGILNSDGSIDTRRVKDLLKLAHPMKVTFHRAFDMVKDPFDSLEKLIDLGVDTILTSGQKSSAWEGRELIRELVQKADGRIDIIAGAGINESNIKKLIDFTGVTQCHSSAKVIAKSKMSYKRSEVSMGGHKSLSEYETIVVDPEKVRLMKESVLLAEKAY